MRKTKGITLIALVITIVVLIILTAVVINLSLENNGIFNRAKTAKEQYVNAAQYEEEQIGDLTNSIDQPENDSTIAAEQILFTPADTNWTGITNVKQALDYLYNN